MGKLVSPYLKQSARLQSAAGTGPPLVEGESSTGVALMQGGFVELGYAMPKSTTSNKGMDGIFGSETRLTVISFQGSEKLQPDGIVGPLTLGALDARLLKKASPKKPPMPPKHRPRRPAAPVTPKPPGGSPPPFSFDNGVYRTGTGDPPLGHDAGAGPWNSESKQLQTIALKGVIVTNLDKAMIYPGINATRHMRHYFANHGRNLTVNMESMIANVPLAQEAMVGEFRQVQRFVQMLPVGRHQFTSKSAESSYNYKDQSADWFFAVGGYSYWGQGTVNITMVGGQRKYDVEFVYKMFDRYNWDGGKSVTLVGITITDEFMGEFHRQGLAQEFNCYGEVRRQVSWTGDVNVPPDATITRPNGRS
ncbi:MAG: peptidoglycan-binding protein [Bryobacterales bacterium]|nr:peptidoglycan-binding protein [Bryobacterales bacterium]